MLSIIPVLGLSYLLGIHNVFGVVIYEEQWVGTLLALYFAGVFLTFPASRKIKDRPNRLPWYDGLLVIVGVIPGLYLAWNYPTLVYVLGTPSPTRTFLGVLTLLLLGEALRRTLGWSLVIVLAVIVAYGLTSSSFSGMLGGSSISLDRLMNYTYVDPSSILGMLGIGATLGLAFIFFGQVLLNYGAGSAITNLAILAFGRYRGGGAKAAVAGSSLAGTVSGAPMSNVFLTGRITIPLMKRTGYKSSTAAAVEALASTGGQIMPPVMGIAAFLIAENLGMPYAEVALAAAIPAILLYLTIFLSIDLEAGKQSLTHIPRSDMPARPRTLKESWLLIPTVGSLIFFLFVLGMQPGRAAVFAGLISIPIMLLLPKNRKGFGRSLGTLARDTGLVVLDIAGVLAAAGVVVGVVSITGVGFNFANSAANFAGGNIILLLIAAAVAAIILGMGMPSVAAYALVAVLLVPGIIAAGIDPLSAHMFVFYFAVISNITPPIAVAAFAAAVLSGSKPMVTAFEAMRLGWAFFLIPFLFVISPSLLLQGDWQTIMLVTFTAALGIVFVSVGVIGYMRRSVPSVSRILFLLAGVALIVPPGSLGGIICNLAGGVVGTILLLIEVRASRIPDEPVTEKKSKVSISRELI